VVGFLAMFCLSFIVIRIGYGFELTRDLPRLPRTYAWDCFVGTTTSVFPWFLCTVYFVLAMAPSELWGSSDLWREGVLLGRFAAPTSVGLLFSMLAAAGLSGTWIYRKARILAIFDDLGSILLFVPLKIFLLSRNLGLTVVVLVIFALLWAAWKYIHVANLPVTWPWVMVYSVAIVAVSEGISRGGKVIDDTVPVEVEVLLLAFLLGGMLARSRNRALRGGDAPEGGEEELEHPREQLVATIMSACFMALVGLSIPQMGGLSSAPAQAATNRWLKYEGVPPELLARKAQYPGWGILALHVLAITVLSNVGKMFPALCYRKEANRRERLALAIGMFPRGEVGAGMLVFALSYGIAGPALTVAVLSLALNLLCSALCVLVIKRLVATED
jgi:Kef-type K+ transport system membrane component KefB